MQKLEKTELRKADRTVGVNCIILQLTPTVRSAFLSLVFLECGVWNINRRLWNVRCGLWNVKCGM